MGSRKDKNYTKEKEISRSLFKKNAICISIDEFASVKI